MFKETLQNTTAWEIIQWFIKSEKQNKK